MLLLRLFRMLSPFHPRLGLSIMAGLLLLLSVGEVSGAPEYCEKAEACIKDLRSEDLDRKLNAIRVLGVLGGEQAVPHLVRLAEEDDDEVVLRSAVRSLGVIGDPSAVAALIKFLTDAPYLQDETIRALMDIGGGKATQAFVSALNNNSAQMAALQGLAKIGDRSVRPALRDLYRQTDDDRIRGMTAMTLQRISARLGPTAEEMGAPIYPGSKYFPNVLAEWIFTTEDPAEKVAQFYHQNLKSAPLDFEAFKKEYEKSLHEESQEIVDGIPPEKPEIIFVLEQQSFEGKDYPSKLIFIKGGRKTEIRIHLAVDG